MHHRQRLGGGQIGDCGGKIDGSAFEWPQGLLELWRFVSYISQSPKKRWGL
jgi:hypothetical protein